MVDDARAAPAPRFLCDAMLGRLARWLRVLGYDTAYDPTVHDPALVAWASAEHRTLLTRDRALVEQLRPPSAILVRGDAPLQQLEQIAEECRLPPPVELFGRCMVCNTLLRPATAAEAVALAPERARGLPGPVRRCPECARVYWPGSHARRMRATLARAFPHWELDGR